MSKRYPGGIIRKTPQTPSQTSAQGIWDMASVTQAVKENNWPIAGVPDPISKSLRFRSSASAYLNRTLTTPTNNLKWTWSGWVKRGTLSVTNVFFGAGDGSSNNFGSLQFTTSDTLQFAQINGGSYNVQMVTSAVFRDPSAWYHIQVVYDSANATSTDRVQIYVNGVRQSVTYTTGPFAPNTASKINSAIAHYISKLDYTTIYFDGYLAEVYFIDGQALTPSSFGNTNDQTGVWQPIAYTGTYGTNGFYLPFSNTASTSTLGNDFSGNSNNWTTNNISLTSGSTYDSMVDVPTPWIPYNTAGDTGALWRGNYCVLNAINTGRTLSNGNLNYAGAASGVSLGTIAVSSGKWYWETVLTGAGGSMTGIATATTVGSLSWVGSDANSYGYYTSGQKYTSGSGAAYGASWTTNDVIGVALDMDAGTLTFYKNNTSQGTAYSGLTGSFVPAVGNNSTNDVGFVNFGQRPFSYTPPSGFKTLCTTNLTTPTIGATASTTANKYFNANLYTGNGTTNAITNVGFQPDLVWVKSRSDAYFHGLYDAVRGAGSTKGLYSNDTVAEGTYSDFQNLVSFDSNGFTLGATSNTNNINANTSTFVGWNWKANGAGSTNTAGSITSTVSANTAAGFSVVTYTGNGTSGATVGHGLGVAPSMVILKQRDGASSWQVKHVSLNANQNLILNSTAAVDTAPGSGYISAISSTTLTLLNGGSAITNVNANNGTYVAYCFAQVAGYSAFGSYTGNASTDGPFIFTGFRPKFVMIKSSSTGGAGYDWFMWDSSRNTYNVIDHALWANLSDAENTTAMVDFVSNGFKLRLSSSAMNGSGTTFIYMAFAESPFKYSLGR